VPKRVDGATIASKELPMKALVAIDGSTESALAIETAASLTWPAGSQLEVLTVLPGPAELFGGLWEMAFPYVPDDWFIQLQAEGQGTVDQAAARLRRPGLDVAVRVEEGRAASVIVDAARRMGADLIILGARGHGVIQGALLGSVSAEVVDQAHSAVLVARRGSIGRILIGTDGSEVARSAVDFVARSGLFPGAETRVAYAIDLHPDWWLGFVPGDGVFASESYAAVAKEGRRHAREVTSQAADSLRSNGLSPTTDVLDGPAGPAIANEAKSWGADVVVVGTRGNGLMKRLVLGSTARSLLHHADASVLITRLPTPVVSGGESASRETEKVATGPR
jgi:nucleotide-binding universal stress UspA family protein